MSTVTIRCSGVPEHFNLPWKLALEKNLFKQQGIDLIWIDNGGGTGAMCKDLKEDKIDMAIVLTEGAISNLHQGNPSKICSFYVDSPLIWGVHTSSNCQFKKEQLLERPSFAISRYTSGSHLMAYLYLMANKIQSPPKFNIVNDLNGARKSLNENQDQLFLWEKFTTKPLVDKGEFSRIDEMPTPWPAFVVLASDKLLSLHANKVEQVLTIVQELAQQLKTNDATILEIANRYRINTQDAQIWLKNVKWSNSTVVDKQVIKEVTITLAELGLLNNKLNAEAMIHFGENTVKHSSR